MAAKTLLIAFSLYVLVCGAFCQNECMDHANTEGRDLTLSRGAFGSDVVRAAVSKIEASGIFGVDYQFLRRIAYVETNDGTDNETYGEVDYHGGIWRVDKDDFESTQGDMYANLTIKIKDVYGIEWEGVQWEELRKPFCSALAARLITELKCDNTPVISLRSQANCWARQYRMFAPEKRKSEVTRFKSESKVLGDVEGNRIMSIHKECTRIIVAIAVSNNNNPPITRIILYTTLVRA